MHIAHELRASVVSIAALASLAGACGTSPGTASSANETPAVACGVDDVTGMIPGVRISIHSAKCSYRSGEHAEFTYTVTTDASAPSIDVAASMGCGSCRSYSSDPMSFVSWSIFGTSDEGRAQQYCLCDTGCCAPDTAQTVKVDAATKSASITWSGHVWQGPSDTGNREGEAFGPGHYDVVVVFSGGSRGSVQAKLPITIVP